MADYLTPLQPNLNPMTPKIKSVVAQPAIDPLKTKWHCPICLKTMPQFYRDCHIKLHASFCCPKCKIDFPLNYLGLHLIECMDIFTPYQFVCWVCGAANCNMRHMKAKHIPLLTCSIPGCGKPFTPDSFAGHIKGCLRTYAKRIESSVPTTKPTAPRPSIQKIQTADNKQVQYKCLFCASVFSKDGLLQKHIERVHIKHTCPVCTGRDITEANFSNHISKCLKQRKSEDRCPICCKLLANTTDHIHNVHTSLMISCPSCKQKFKCATISKHIIACQESAKLCQTSKSDSSYYEIQRGLTKSNLTANNSRPVPTATPRAISFSEQEFPPLNPSGPSKLATLSEVKPKALKQASCDIKQVRPMRSISPNSNSDLTSLFNEND